MTRETVLLDRRHAGLGALLMLAGCAAPPEKTADDPGVRMWPTPPERPRFVWLGDLRSPGDLTPDDEESRTRRLLAGTVISREPAFEKPSAVAAQAGRVYVADTVGRRIVVFDVPRRKLFLMGLRPPGTVQKPSSIALDARGRVYVADTTLRKVFVYDHIGLYQRTIGSRDELERPTGVAVEASGERIYIVDRGESEGDRHRVLAYDAEGRLLREIGRRGHGVGEFNIPVQATVTPDNTLWVLDAGNFRVQAFDRDGRYLRSFGQVGNGLGQFARPRGLASDSQGRLYVSDAAFGNVQVFTPEGELLIALGQSSRRDRPGYFGLPLGVWVDEGGRVFVVDQLFNKVSILRPVGDEEAAQLIAEAEKARQAGADSPARR